MARIRVPRIRKRYKFKYDVFDNLLKEIELRKRIIRKKKESFL